MPETRQKVPAKTYLCIRKELSVSFPIANGGIDTMRFVNGEFTTVYADEQEHIERLPLSHGISVKPSERAVLEEKAKTLLAAAVEANAAAKAAADAVAALDKPANPVKPGTKNPAGV